MTDDKKQALLDDLRQSIHEAMTGQTIPASELPAALDEVDIRVELKEGLRQSLLGETVPVESLWDDDDE